MSASHANDLRIINRSEFRAPVGGKKLLKRGVTRANLGEELIHNTVRVKV